MTEKQRTQFKKKIAKGLRTLRLQRHLTQIELGEEIGVSKASISRWETGVTEPDIQAREALEKIYGKPLETLLGVEAVDWVAN